MNDYDESRQRHLDAVTKFKARFDWLTPATEMRMGVLSQTLKPLLEEDTQAYLERLLLETMV